MEEQQGVTLSLGELRERGLQGLGALLGEGLALGVGGVGGGGLLVRVSAVALGGAGAGAARVEGDVARDAEGPRAQGLAGAQAVVALEQAAQRLLRGVLDVGVGGVLPEQPRDQATQGRAQHAQLALDQGRRPRDGGQQGVGGKGQEDHPAPTSPEGRR